MLRSHVKTECMLPLLFLRLKEELARLLSAARTKWNQTISKMHSLRFRPRRQSVRAPSRLPPLKQQQRQHVYLATRWRCSRAAIETDQPLRHLQRHLTLRHSLFRPHRLERQHRTFSALASPFCPSQCSHDRKQSCSIQHLNQGQLPTESHFGSCLCPSSSRHTPPPLLTNGSGRTSW